MRKVHFSERTTTSTVLRLISPSEFVFPTPESRRENKWNTKETPGVKKRKNTDMKQECELPRSRTSKPDGRGPTDRRISKFPIIRDAPPKSSKDFGYAVRKISCDGDEEFSEELCRWVTSWSSRSTNSRVHPQKQKSYEIPRANTAASEIRTKG